MNYKVKLDFKHIFKSFAFAIIYTIGSITSLSAQTEGIMSQYMHSKTAFNPAAVGEQQLMQVIGVQRLQWIGIDNAPITTNFSFHSPFKLGNTLHGAGIHFVYDQYGMFSNQQVNLQYAYKFKMGEGELSIGTKFGFANIAFNGDSAKWVDSEYHDKNDPSVPKGAVSGMGFDLGLGIYYASQNWFAGIAAMHLVEPTIQLDDNTDFSLKRTFTAMGGYNFKLNNPDYKLKPSALIISDFVSWQVQTSLILDYQDKVWGGLAYRLQDAVSFMLGMRILNGLSIGYTYDLPANRIIKATHGSHELFLSYDFSLALGKQEKKYKSIRYL